MRRDFNQADPALDVLEAQWMRELAAGGNAGREALARLFRVYDALFVRRLEVLGVKPQAADVAQELWMEIARAAPRYRGEMPVRIFLLGFLKMARRRHFADPSRARDEISLDDEADVAAELGELPASGKLGSDWLDFAHCVRKALAKFEASHPRLAQLLLARHVDELSLDEMVELLGGEPMRAKAEVFSARRKFQPIVAPCLDLWPDRAHPHRSAVR